MRVKSILMNNFRNLNDTPSTSDGGGIFRFYDEHGKLIESGAVVSDSLTKAETENFILEASSIWNSTANYKVLNGFNTEIVKDLSIDIVNTINPVSVNSPAKDNYIKLTFKKPRLISKIEYFTMFTNSSSTGISTSRQDMTFIDIYNNEKTFVLSSNARNELQKIKFKDLNAIRRYNINEVASSIYKIENFDKITKLDIDFSEKTNTKIRIGFSFDKVNWLKVENDSYININSVINEGNELSEIDFLPKTTNLLGYLKIELITTDKDISSKLKKIGIKIKR